MNGLPKLIVIDRSGHYTGGIYAVNRLLKSFGA
jgi:hypothetical protein